MKNLKKVSAILLAVMMMLAVSVTAFAAGAADTTGSITIKGSEKSTEYDFYKIMSLRGQDTTNDGKLDAVSYTIAPKWENFFKGSADGAGYLIAESAATPEQKSTLSQINFNGTLYYLNIKEDTVVAFTNSAMAYAIDTPVEKDTDKTGTGSDVSVANLPLGYYLMIPVDASIKTPNSSGSVASLTSTVPNADINVKAVKPSIQKKDNTVSADVGQTVTYEITGKIPNTAGYSNYVYQISDVMTEGLTFKKDVVVTIEGVTDPITDQCTIDYKTVPNAFTATIHVEDLQKYVGKTITLKYTAVVNEKAIVSSQEKNKAQLKYGHDPKNLEEGLPVEEEVYSAKIIINKYTGANVNGTKLENAKFALMNSEGKYYKYTEATNDTPAKVEWVTVANAPTDGTASVTDAMADALKSSNDITTKVTDKNGAASFDGIKDGTYYLVEFEAPDGYNRLDKPQKVEVKGTDVDSEEHPENVAFASQKEFDSAQNAIANVENKTGSVLPSTGGMGTTLFTIIGTALMAGAVVIFVAKRKMA